jgi:hypothetical protein
MWQRIFDSQKCVTVMFNFECSEEYTHNSCRFIQQKELHISGNYEHSVPSNSPRANDECFNTRTRNRDGVHGHDVLHAQTSFMKSRQYSAGLFSLLPLERNGKILYTT